MSSVTVNGLLASGGTAAGSASAHWTGTVYLNPGANRVDVIATDASTERNKSTATITVTLANLVPTVTQVEPNEVAAGGVGFTLRVTGTNFVPGSTVRWNGDGRPTTYEDATHLTATISADDVAMVGAATVTVFNPAPGGGTSGGMTVAINPVSASGTLQFALSTPTRPEGTGSVEIDVTRTGGSYGAVTVTVITSDLTATAGSDYTAISEVVTFAAGDTTPKTVNIPITNDTTPETAETFTVSLSAATGGATIGTPSTATITIVDDDSSSQERIVFAKEEAEALYDLWMVAPDGSGLERLTDEAKNGHDSQSPILFPDGRRLVFWRDYNIFGTRPGDEYGDCADDRWSVWRLRVSHAASVAGRHQDRLHLRPGDWRIVSRVYTYEIWMMNADGSNKTRITENSYRDGDALFSPDGTKLLITHYQGAPASDCCNATDLFVRDLATGAETLLYGTNSYDWASDWSAAGVLFLTQDGSSGIGFIQADGNGFRQVVPGETQATGAVFSPNDAQIVFTAPTEGGRMLFLANSDGSSATPIPGTEGAYANERAGDWGMVDLSARPPAIVVQPDHVDVPEGGTASFSVSLARQPSSDISVSVSRADGSDADLTIQGTPDLTFTTANWSQLQMVTIAAAVDADQVNGTATFLVSTAGGTPVFVSATEIEPVVLTPGVLQFSAGTHWQLESGGQATATVTRTGGSAGIVSVTVTSSDVTATSGNDYTAVSQVLTFGDGDTTPKTVDIPIINDTNPETAETFTVSLSAPTGGATIGSPATMLVTIADDDVSQGPVVLGVMETVPRNAITFIDSQGTALASIPLPAAGQMFSVSDDGSTILYSVAGTTGGDYALWTYDVATATHTYLFNAMWSQTIRWLPGSNTDFVYARSDQKLHRYSIPTATSSVWQDIDTLAPFGVNNFRGGISWDDSGSRVLVRAGRAYGGGDIVMLGRLCSADATHHICDLQAFSPTYGGSSSWTNVSYSPAMSWTGDVGYFIKRESSTNYYVIERNTVSGAERTVHSLLNDSAGLNNVVVLDPSSIAIVGPANGVFRQVLSCDAGGSGCGVIHSRSEGSLNWLESVRPVGALAAWLDSQPAGGRVAYYPFDGTFDDLSGSGHDGTGSAVAFEDDRSGIPSMAGLFSGAVPSYVQLPGTTSLVLNDAFSVAFWGRFDGSGVIVERDLIGTFTTDWHTFLTDTGELRFTFGTHENVYSTKSVMDGVWHHVAFVRDRASGTLKIYIDGKLDVSEAGHTFDLTGNAQINVGAWDTPGGWQSGFTGALDDLVIYDRLLTEQEISTMAAYLPPCAYSLDPSSSGILGAAAGGGSFVVMTAGACGWAAATGHEWIHATSAGTGSGTVTYTVDANAGPWRSGTITVGGKTFSVTQAGVVLPTPIETIINGALFVAKVGFPETTSWDVGAILAHAAYSDGVVDSGYLVLSRQFSDFSPTPDGTLDPAPIPEGIGLTYIVGPDRTIHIAATGPMPQALTALFGFPSNVGFPLSYPSIGLTDQEMAALRAEGLRDHYNLSPQFLTLSQIAMVLYKDWAAKGLVSGPLSSADILRLTKVDIHNNSGQPVGVGFGRIATNCLKSGPDPNPYIDRWWPKGAADACGTASGGFSVSLTNPGGGWFTWSGAYADNGTTASVRQDGAVVASHANYGGDTFVVTSPGSLPQTVELGHTNVWSGNSAHFAVVAQADELTLADVWESPQVGEVVQPVVYHLEPGWQGDSCAVAFGTPPSGTLPAVGGGGSIAIAGAPGCAWRARTTVLWLHTTSAGTGGGTVNYTADPNPSESARVGTIRVGSLTLLITQTGQNTGQGGDFTGDLKSDVLWRHATGGDVWLWPMDGAARTAESYVRTVADTNWEIRAIADFDGDGKADLLWRNKTTGQLYFWPMDGSAPLAEIYVGTVDPAYDIVGTGDFDGDGQADILWRHLTAGRRLDLADGRRDAPRRGLRRPVDPGYVVKGVGDLDGDRQGRHRVAPRDAGRRVGVADERHDAARSGLGRHRA